MIGSAHLASQAQVEERWQSRLAEARRKFDLATSRLQQAAQIYRETPPGAEASVPLQQAMAMEHLVAHFLLDCEPAFGAPFALAVFLDLRFVHLAPVSASLAKLHRRRTPLNMSLVIPATLTGASGSI